LANPNPEGKVGQKREGAGGKKGRTGYIGKECGVSEKSSVE